MLIDCDRCEMRDIACSDCVVNVLLNGAHELDHAEERAIGVLADAGMVPPLRLAVVGQEDRPDRRRRGKNAEETWSRGLPQVRSAG